jgi:DNA-binding NarL/FixJ family response regulator
MDCVAAHTAHRTLRLLLADDHEVVRVAMRHALAFLAPSIDWREAADAAAVEAALDLPPATDLALIDLHMPGGGTCAWIAGLRARHPGVPLVVLSADESPALVRSLIDQGVAGFIPKSESAAIIVHAVRLVLSGGTYAPLRVIAQAADVDQRTRAPHLAAGPAAPLPLTSRQADVLRLLAHGLPNKSIARQLGISEGTVKVHLLGIFRALGVHNRTQAVVAAQKDSGPTAVRPPCPECQGVVARPVVRLVSERRTPGWPAVADRRSSSR